LQQAARQRLHVAPGYGLRQKQFDHFMIAKSVRPAFQQSLAQALSVACGGRLASSERALFIEKRGVVGHNLHNQLPFQRSQRK
jgi:hypothetical protein